MRGWQCPSTHDFEYSCFRGRGTASSPGSGDAAHGKAFQSKEDALFQQDSLGVVVRLLLLDDGDATMDAIRSLSGGSASPALLRRSSSVCVCRSTRAHADVTTGASRSTFELDLVRAGILGKFGFWAIWESAGKRGKARERGELLFPFSPSFP